MLTEKMHLVNSFDSSAGVVGDFAAILVLVVDAVGVVVDFVFAIIRLLSSRARRIRNTPTECFPNVNIKVSANQLDRCFLCFMMTRLK